MFASSLAWHPASPGAVAARLRSSGWAGVEFLCEPPWTPELWTPVVVQEAKASGLRWTLHAPVTDLHLLSLNRRARRAAQEEIEAALRLAHQLGAEGVTIHLGLRSLMGVGDRLDESATQSLLRSLHRQAQDAGVVLALENDPPLPGALLADLEAFARLLAEAGIPGTLDVGHAWLAHGPQLIELLPPVLPLLHAAHLHDNRGQQDEHLAVEEGSIPWRELWPHLQQVPLLVVEAKDGERLELSRARLRALDQAV